MNKVEEFLVLRLHGHKGWVPTDLTHIIDIIRQSDIPDEEMISDLLTLYKEGRVVFSEEGGYFGISPARWNEKEWEEAQQTGNFRNTFLRSCYRQGFKKTELTSERHIMREISKLTANFIDETNRMRHVQPT